ncbi:hypothetical protein PLICRDRAFT_32185 [Plicaturopsis crispa FD-325 SS-3]|uniref:Protein kinase domain-containing protein n=1 Tax=Plicaturopsis crispa FD-325 SS-3 TaxID=944288 RepID=A0A0C9SL71_PLICR|nr:hypothetical protein PLICRDRAFT_32185 [Plicaturopsis crispa FD-325 SS-3]
MDIDPGVDDISFIHPPETRSSRGVLRTELKGNVVYNDKSIFTRLGVSQVPEILVEQCVAPFVGNAGLQRSKKELLRLVASASDHEVRMYPHLYRVFEHIETFSADGTRAHQRQFVPGGSATLTAEGETWAFPREVPDFALLDIDDDNPRVRVSFEKNRDDAPTRLWRVKSGWVAVKVKVEDGPVPASIMHNRDGTDTDIQDMLTQAADYARLHLSARPFQLYSVGLLIFGSKFCVGFFDRDGVQLSPVHDMWADFGLFVRVVRRMACDMSPEALGRDPSAVLLRDDDPKRLQALDALGSEDARTVPAYAVAVGGGKDRRVWVTVGPPIWSSYSLLGRGTSVWRAYDPKSGRLLVLKNAWRSSKRTPESAIYRHIRGSHPGLALFDSGGDVIFPGEKVAISAQRLRDFNDLGDGETAILHRIVIETLGRPLWDYSTELELLLGIRAAMKGHQFLYEQGILHRDVSGGNVMLSADAALGAESEGFLMDVEYARVEGAFLDKVTVTDIKSVNHGHGIHSDTGPAKRTHTHFSSSRVLRGAAMTGTLQFMAFEILEAVGTSNSIKHQVWHDIESFIWVLCYTVLRRMVRSPLTPLSKEQKDIARDNFLAWFGHSNIRAITTNRTALTGPLAVKWYQGMLSVPMTALYERLHQLLLHGQSGASPLAYDSVFAALDEAISAST